MSTGYKGASISAEVSPELLGVGYIIGPRIAGYLFAGGSLGAAIEIRVEDTPPGVPGDDLGRLFDPLYRADPSRSRAFGGSGLGLAIARAIAQAHGGQLRAEASSLGGLAMVLTLPLKQP